jgi:hypothetical protein
MSIGWWVVLFLLAAFGIPLIDYMLDMGRHDDKHK